MIAPRPGPWRGRRITRPRRVRGWIHTEPAREKTWRRRRKKRDVQPERVALAGHLAARVDGARADAGSRRRGVDRNTSEGCRTGKYLAGSVRRAWRKTDDGSPAGGACFRASDVALGLHLKRKGSCNSRGGVRVEAGGRRVRGPLRVAPSLLGVAGGDR